VLSTDEGIGLSAPVAAAVDEGAATVTRVVAQVRMSRTEV